MSERQKETRIIYKKIVMKDAFMKEKLFHRDDYVSTCLKGYCRIQESFFFVIEMFMQEA